MAQQTDEQLRQEATVITTETTPGANTANRVGTMFTNSIDSKINNDVISADTALGTSDSLIPTQNAVKVYADGLVVGLLNDRGGFAPDTTPVGTYPTSGGSGEGGTILKGDIWFMTRNGYLGNTAVSTGASVRALINSPDDATDADWNILNTGVGFTPENVANKSTNVALGTSNILYPTQNAVRQYVVNQSFAKTDASSDNTFLSDNTFNGNTAFNGSVNINNSFTTSNFPMSINGITGTAGQILTSQGGADAPTWETNTAATLGGNNTFTNTNQFNDTVQFNEEVTLDGGVVISSVLSAGGAGTTGQVLTSQGGSAAPIWANAGNPSGWSLTGNAGTTPGTNFIGTTDTQDLVFKTNNTERLRINAGGTITTAKSVLVYTSGSGAVSMSVSPFTKGNLNISNGTGDGTVRAENLTTSRIYQLPDASGTLALTSDIPTSSGWGLTGNTGTNPAVNFIGTTDNKNLVFKTNNAESLRIESEGDIYSKKDITIVADSSSTQTRINVIQASGGFYSASMGQNTSRGGYLQINGSSTGFNEGVLLAQNLTASRTYQLPDASGTLALEAYTVYSVILTYDGTTIYKSVLKNTIGDGTGNGTTDINWVSNLGSFLQAQMTSNPFTANKTVVLTAGSYYASPNLYNVFGKRNSSSLVVLNSHRTSDGAISSSVMNDFFVEIRVYP
jgi:hypothetical protein